MIRKRSERQIGADPPKVLLYLVDICAKCLGIKWVAPGRGQKAASSRITPIDLRFYDPGRPNSPNDVESESRA